MKAATTATSDILIVEDEAKIASFLARALAACDFESASAPNSFAAIKMLERHHYHLLLLDLLLPDGDGFMVLERALEVRSDQEVLVLSALSDVESKIKCLELGASDYVTKPFVLGELVARIRARMRQSKELSGTRYLELARVRLDLQRRIALVNGAETRLSTREFQLLEHLMRKGGEVCAREELLESVWGYTFDPGSNVVDVYVRRLRNKLGENVIETVRSVGYCYPAAA